MKLRYTSTSPYVRKVCVTALETGLDDRIERVVTDTRNRDSGIARDNPLGKVPALITDEGEKLYDSPVICEYLDSLTAGPRLFPPEGPERWQALRLQALGDGMLDAALLAMIETKRRPEALRWADWMALQQVKIQHGLDQLEREAAALDGPLTIGTITVGCALGYLDFRFAEDDWRHLHPALAAWYEAFSRRPSMRATVPRDNA